jgi:hypothetical protein
MIVLAALIRWLHLFVLTMVFGASALGVAPTRSAMGSLNVARLLFYASLAAAATAARKCFDDSGCFQRRLKAVSSLHP